ncbi:DEAD/DEAH box helicase family protein [Hymenobacter sp. HD11105]
MQLHQLPYRDEAVRLLRHKTVKLLAYGTFRQKLIFKAPTGSGKTVALALLLRDLASTLPVELTLPANRRKVAYLWLAPGRLHEQSLKSLSRFFDSTREVRTLDYDALDASADSVLEPNDVLFLNWASVNQDNRRLTTPNERGHTIWRLLRNTELNGTELVVIIDEEHLEATRGPKAEAFLVQVKARLEIRVSATPLSNSPHYVEVDRQDVVKAEMIKKGVELNPALVREEQKGRALEVVLLEKALIRRQELAAAYAAQGTNINPLLLIQLPSDRKQITQEDRDIRATVEQYLTAMYGINEANGKLAIWLSGEKENLDDISRDNNPVEVLLFKQAIALGWDCPRASVLLIYRELKQENFAVQTVGRILRMPEQRHYPDESLNVGYVYTNLNRDLIKIVPESADYLSLSWAERREDIYQPLQLRSYAAGRRTERNRIGYRFKEALFAVAQEKFGLTQDVVAGVPYEEGNRRAVQAGFINLNVQELPIVVPTDVHLDGADVEAVQATHKERFAHTPDEIQSLYEHFCYRNCGDYQPDASHERVRLHLKLWFEEWLGYYEHEAYRIVLHNQQAFTDLLGEARSKYKEIMAEAAHDRRRQLDQRDDWEVPTPRRHAPQDVYFEAPKSIMQPVLLRQRDPAKPDDLMDSRTEFQFLQLLEAAPGSAVQWWYKNGQQGTEHFAIPYYLTPQAEIDGDADLFYPDFLVLFGDGTLGIFDPKTAGSDPTAVLKHNALVKYMTEQNALGKRLVGGIVLPHEGSWRYSQGPITSDKDHLHTWSVLKLTAWACAAVLAI